MTRALVVDDDLDIREAIRAALEDEGFEVVEAPDGGPALARMQASEEPLVVLLDLQMPGVSGAEVMRRVVAQPALGERHAFIVMTANDRTIPLATDALIRAVGAPMLWKPFDLDRLVALAHEAAARVNVQVSPAQRIAN